MKLTRFSGILAWVILVGILLVGLTITIVNLLDRRIIEQTAAQNMHAEFLRAAASVGRLIRNAGDIHDVAALREAFQDIFELRPGIRRLEVFEVSSGSALILSSDPQQVSMPLSVQERTEVTAGRSVAHFDNSFVDRAWLITAPIMVDGRVVGALRGRFSLWKYDNLIEQEGELAKDIGIGAVAITCLVFLILIRVKVHAPIRRLLDAMRSAEAGDLMSQAPLLGPSDIQEVASQFNRLLARVREADADKERLLGEIRCFNETLVTKVAEATEELRRTSMMLVEARTQAERAQKLAALGELSAMVAHELGNPLNAMSGHLQMLAKEADPCDRDRRLTIIRSELDRMVGTIRAILDLTRLQIRPGGVDLNAVVQEVLALVFSGSSVRRVMVRTDLATALPPVAGDRRMLHGVLLNLVTNAIRAMPNGGELEVVTQQVLGEKAEGTLVLPGGPELEDGAVRLAVRDTGHGILPEHLPSIFEPFFTTGQSKGGTGLGLAICRRVVSSCGGRLVVQSAVGRGTTFTVDWPIWKGDIADGR